MAVTKPKPIQKTEIAQQLAAAIRRTAIHPTIYGYKAQSHQIPFHTSTKTGRLFLGGNRAGKTVAGAADLVMQLTGQNPYRKNRFETPVRCRAIGVDFENGIKKIILPEVARWLPPSMLINGSWEDSYEKSSRTLRLVNDSFVEFMSYDQDKDKFAGTSRHYVWFDEEPPEGIFNENLLRLADVNGTWAMTMTPLIDMSWTIDRLYEPAFGKDHPNIDVWEVNTEENKYVNESTLDILLEGLDESERQARKAGKFLSHTGSIYGSVLTTDIIVPDLIGTSRWKSLMAPSSRWGHFGMLDHGFTNPTAFLLAAFDEEGRVIVYDEYYQAGKTIRENTEEILKLIREREVGAHLQYIVADPAIRQTSAITGTTTQTEYAEHGLYLSPGNNDVRAGINRVFNRLSKNQIYISERCEKLLWEMKRYRWDTFASEKTKTKNNPKETPMKKNDHACDALRYGIVSRPTLPGEVDIKFTNVLNAPVAIDPNVPFIDEELVAMNDPEKSYYDPYLGSDW
jgi:phage terminase large subunit-like protein